MMKKLIFILFIALTGISSSLMSQEYVPVIEAKIAPIKMILGGISGGADFVLNDNMSIESVLQYKKRSIVAREVLSVQGFGKYYLNSKRGADRFYMGPYLKIQRREFDLDGVFANDKRIALGLITGFKVVSKSGFTVDFTGGFGRRLYSKIDEVSSSQANVSPSSNSGQFDYISRMSIGYRFGTVNDMSNEGKLQRKLKSNQRK